jgi:hypothetical protein
MKYNTGIVGIIRNNLNRNVPINQAFLRRQRPGNLGGNLGQNSVQLPLTHFTVADKYYDPAQYPLTCDIFTEIPDVMDNDDAVTLGDFDFLTTFQSGSFIPDMIAGYSSKSILAAFIALILLRKGL